MHGTGGGTMHCTGNTDVASKVQEGRVIRYVESGSDALRLKSVNSG